jgi:hypothetical protein
MDQLARACAVMCDPKKEAAFRALEPEDKWGTLENAREVMAELLAAASLHQDHEWEVQ